MAENSKIEWTHHTLNFWWGCIEYSPGCTHCYAKTLANRFGRDVWGPAETTGRWRTKGPWRDCLKWDKKAGSEGKRRMVFCQSMSDFFEDHSQLTSWRNEAIEIIEKFQWLDVQLLTKRIENVLGMVPSRWLENWPRHIWIGTSVENQETADTRIPDLLKIPAAVRFLSMEPLLSPVDIRQSFEVAYKNKVLFSPRPGKTWQDEYGLHWVIVGGESGPHARPMHPEWVRSIRDQCQKAGVPFFFKQWGAWNQGCGSGSEGIHMSEDGQIVRNFAREYRPFVSYVNLSRVGKKSAGRLLDGREWNEFPKIMENE